MTIISGDTWGINKDKLNTLFKGGVTITMGSPGGVMEIGDYIDIPPPKGFTITGYKIMAGQTGSVAIDILKSTLPATPSTSITGLAPISITDGKYGADGTLTGWTKSVVHGEALRLIVTSCTSIETVSITLEVDL